MHHVILLCFAKNVVPHIIKPCRSIIPVSFISRTTYGLQAIDKYAYVWCLNLQHAILSKKTAQQTHFICRWVLLRPVRLRCVILGTITEEVSGKCTCSWRTLMRACWVFNSSSGDASRTVHVPCVCVGVCVCPCVCVFVWLCVRMFTVIAEKCRAMEWYTNKAKIQQHTFGGRTLVKAHIVQWDSHKLSMPYAKSTTHLFIFNKKYINRGNWHCQKRRILGPSSFELECAISRFNV